MIKKLIYLIVFLASTVCFVVLFENGPENFPANLQKKFNEISALATGGSIKREEEKPAAQ